MSRPDPHVLVLQRQILVNARRHGVTQEAIAAHLGMSRSGVSHLACSGDQAREMRLGELLGIAALAGTGAGASEVLAPLTNELGVSTRASERSELDACVLRAAREGGEAVVALLGMVDGEAPQGDHADVEKCVAEVREAVNEFQAVLRKLLADGGVP